MAFVVNFEKESCGRCGGSGHYSYCQQHGTTCFDCSGSGKRYTKAGAKARQAFEAKRMEVCGVNVEDIKPGMWVLADGKYRLVTEITTADGSRYFDSKIGEWKDYVVIYFKGISHGKFPGTKMIVSNPALWPAMIEFARTMKGAIVSETVAV